MAIDFKYDKATNSIIINAKIEEFTSKSGKSLVLVSSRGNKPAGFKYKGKDVIAGINIYIPKD